MTKYDIKALKKEQRGGGGDALIAILLMAILAGVGIWASLPSNTAVSPAGQPQAVRPTTAESQPVVIVAPTEPAERPQAQRPTQRSVEGEQVAVVNTAVPTTPPTSTAYPTYTPYPTNTAVPPTSTPYPTYTAVPSQTPQATFTAVSTSTPLPTYTPYPTRPLLVMAVTDNHIETWELMAWGGLGTAAVTLFGLLGWVMVGYKPQRPPVVTAAPPPALPAPVQNSGVTGDTGTAPVQEGTITVSLRPVEPEANEALMRELWGIWQSLGEGRSRTKVCLEKWGSKNTVRLSLVKQAIEWGEAQARRGGVTA